MVGSNGPMIHLNRPNRFGHTQAYRTDQWKREKERKTKLYIKQLLYDYRHDPLRITRKSQQNNNMRPQPKKPKGKYQHHLSIKYFKVETRQNNKQVGTNFCRNHITMVCSIHSALMLQSTKQGRGIAFGRALVSVWTGAQKLLLSALQMVLARSVHAFKHSQRQKKRKGITLRFEVEERWQGASIRETGARITKLIEKWVDAGL